VYGAKYGWERANWFALAGVEAKDDITFEIPNWFEHVAEEHRNARENVVLIDQSSFCKFEVEGAGALDFLNRLCANQIDRPVGKVIYTQMCNERGTIECDMTIGRLADPDDGTVFLKEMTSAYAVINVIGPKSRALLEKTTSADLSNNSFSFGTCKSFTVGYAPILSFRVTYVGELGYELYIPTEFAAHVYETLWQAGEEFGIKNAGYRTIASTRLEKGYADWSSELTPEYTPFDAGLAFCVDLGKKDFIGKEALVKIKVEGAKFRLCSFVIDAGRPLMIQGSAPIIHEGKVVAVTTSAGYGHTIGKNICYGYLPIEKASLKDGFEIESYKERYPAKIEPSRVLYDPERKKILV
ncbi:MAG: aminomethyltransferase family protein, partial [Deltaproteobacteria bacterium]|nr:aminomethyltransferase family protein [Deltaproteobacteria bacterium]